MRIFVTGATGVLGRHLVPGLVTAGHEVTATTRTPGKVAQLRQAGAEPVVLDGLDREAVIAAVRAAAPEVIVHEMTALADLRSLRHADQVFAGTNELRTRGTDNLLAAAAQAGTRRVIAQGYAGAAPDKPSGGALKTEADPLDWRSVPGGCRCRPRSRTWTRPCRTRYRRASCCATAPSTGQAPRIPWSRWSGSGGCR
jgi:nucleoside-diphosphate-sugar epimerase